MVISYEVPEGFPVDRMVTAEETQEHWGPLEVRDAKGNLLKGTISVCVSTGIVHTLFRVGDIYYPDRRKDHHIYIVVKYPAPLSIQVLEQ